MKLTAHPSSSHFSKRIKVRIEGWHVATIHCDATVQFHGEREWTVSELDDINNIASNFLLWHQNIEKSTADEPLGFDRKN